MIGIKNYYLFDAFKPNLTKAFQSRANFFKKHISTALNL